MSRYNSRSGVSTSIKYKVMLALQSDIPGGGDHLIIVLRQKVFKVLVNDLLVDLIDQCLCWYNQGKVHLDSMLYLVLDVHSHKEGLPHRCRAGVTEVIIRKVIVGIFLCAKEPKFWCCRNCQIVILVFSEETL